MGDNYWEMFSTNAGLQKYPRRSLELSAGPE